MATNISTITNLIAAFRALTAKNTVTPESVGYLMQLILDTTGAVSESLTSLSKTVDTVRQNVSVLDRDLSGIDINAIEKRVDELQRNIEQRAAQMQKAIDDLKEANTLVDIQTRLEEFQEILDALQDDHTILEIQKTIADLDKSVNSLAQSYSTLRGSVGQASGVAPLNADGVISSRYYDWTALCEAFGDGSVPDNKCVLLFHGFAPEGIEIMPNSIVGSILFCESTGTFIGERLGQYCAGFSGCTDFGEMGMYGVTPDKNKLYINTADNTAYRWNGRKLVALISGATESDGSSTPSVFGVVPFAGAVFESSAAKLLTGEANTSDGEVVYNNASGRFIFRTKDGSLYGLWPEGGLYGTPSSTGTVPDIGRLYCDTTNNNLFRFSDGLMRRLLDDSDYINLVNQYLEIKSLVGSYHPSSSGDDDPTEDETPVLNFKMFPEDVEEYLQDYEDPEDMVPLYEEMEDCDFYEIVWSYKYNDFLALWVKPHMGASEDEDTYVCGLARVFPEWQDYYKETTPKTDVLFSRNGTSEMYLYSDETGTLRKRRGPIHESGADNPDSDSDNGSEDAVGRVYLKADESGRYYVDLSEALSAMTEQEVSDLLENVKSQNQNQ